MTARATLVDRLASWAAATPDAPCWSDRLGSGAWRTTSYSEAWSAVRETARGLIALGLAPGDRVAAPVTNRSETVLVQLATQAARGSFVPIYATLTGEQMGDLAALARARFLAAADAAALEPISRAAASHGRPAERGIVFDGTGAAADALDLEALRALGRELPEPALDERLAGLAPADEALILFTSGTTGRPKGVPLPHRALLANAGQFRAAYPQVFRAGYSNLSYLPLSHIAEQLASVVAPLEVGGTTLFCRRLDQMRDHLLEARPTCFFGVPRVWEKLEAALTERFARAPRFKARLLAWARGVELAAFEAECDGAAERHGLRRRLAHRLVLGKVRAALGLDRVRAVISGAAPIAPSTVRFFASLGLRIHEGYGMSEGCIFTGSVYRRPRPGTVGRPLPGVELRLAEDGEILARTPAAMDGYLDDPVATAERIDAEGWIHTGDLGAFDPDGVLRVVGRKKELIVTAGGKKVAPEEVEGLLRELPGVAQAMVVGDSRPYLVALLTLDAVAAPALAAARGLAAATEAELAADARFLAHLAEEVERRCNARLARYQQVKRFAVLPAEFSVESGELTPTLKLRRARILERCRERIEALYAPTPA